MYSRVVEIGGIKDEGLIFNHNLNNTTNGIAIFFSSINFISHFLSDRFIN
jgi:hypothetical protein